jgi:two-component system chemotaxis response regulator CheB
MNARDVIVVGTSAGGLHALKELVRGLPGDLNATVFVVRHVAPASESLLPKLLQQTSQLEVTQAVNGEEFKRSHIYIAPPDHHMMLEDGHIILSNGPKENRTRPAIDPLFRSAALTFGSRVAGVVLTGDLDDGTAGLWCVKYCGGVTVVQDPNDAASPGMPRSALRHVQIDHCLPIAEIGTLLSQLAGDPVPDATEVVLNQMEIENCIARGDREAVHKLDKVGKLTHFTCPECHGTLWQLRDDNFIRFRCTSGTANTAENLIREQSEITEQFLHAALRETEENRHLGHYLSEHARETGDRNAADSFLFQTAENERKAHLIHQALEGHPKPIVGAEQSAWEKMAPA